MTPTLALCIPAYRAEDHLPRLLATAREQDPPFDEIIVCVDASPDRTAEVAEQWGARVIVNERNLGCSGSKNQALAQVRSDWVHFHDADDILLPEFTRDAHAWMQRPDAPDVVVMGYEWRDYETGELLGIGLMDDEALKRDPLRYVVEHKVPNFGLYRTARLASVGGFPSDPRYLYAEDYAFHVTLALRGFSFRGSRMITSINWRHHSSMSAQNEARCHVSLIALMSDLVGEPRLPSAAREHVRRTLWQSARALIALRGPAEAGAAAIEAAERLRPYAPGSQPAALRALARVAGSQRAFEVLYRAYPWLKAIQSRLRPQ